MTAHASGLIKSISWPFFGVVARVLQASRLAASNAKRGFRGNITSRRLISAKTLVFVDCVVNAFKSERLDVAFSANR
jgi:hypothetical protein